MAAEPGADEGFLGMTLNLTPAGALIRTYRSFEVGTALDLSIRLGGRELAIAALVRHVRADAVGCWHVGVEFQELEDREEQALREHVKAVPERLAKGGARSSVPGRHPNKSFPVEGRVAD